MKRLDRVEASRAQCQLLEAEGNEEKVRADALEKTNRELVDDNQALFQQVLSATADRCWLLRVGLMKCVELAIEDPEMNKCVEKLCEISSKMGRKAAFEDLLESGYTIGELSSDAEDYDAQFQATSDEFNNLSFPRLNEIAGVLHDKDAVAKLKILVDPTTIASSSDAGGGAEIQTGVDLNPRMEVIKRLRWGMMRKPLQSSLLAL